MMQRCYNVKHPNYKNYGARGIAVCAAWQVFFNFLAAMGKRPKGLTLGRKNNDLGYDPDNCRWETSEQQANNKRTTKLFEHDGCFLTLPQWAGKIGMNKSTLWGRVTRGWSLSDALSNPVSISASIKRYRITHQDQGPKRKIPDSDAERVRTAYIQGSSTRNIAALYGVEHATVRMFMRRHGIIPRVGRTNRYRDESVGNKSVDKLPTQE